MLKYGIGRAGFVRRGINPPFVLIPDVVQHIIADQITLTPGEVLINDAGGDDFIDIERDQLFLTGATTFTETETVGIFNDTIVFSGGNVTERETVPITAYALTIAEGDVALPGDTELIAIVHDTVVLTGRTVNEIEGIQVLQDTVSFTGGTVNIPADTDAGSADTVPVTHDTITLTAAVNGILTPADVGSIFVSTTGNDANPGTAASPKATVGNALAAAAAGQYVIIRGGTYTTAQNLQSSGTSGAKKTVRNFQNETVIFDGAGHSAGTVCFNIGADNIRVIGITVRNSRRMGIGTWESTGLEIIGVTSHGNWEGGIWVGGGAVGASNNCLIQGCTAFDNMRHNAGQAMGSGGWAVGIMLSNSDNSQILNCKSYESWGEGIGILSSQNCVVRNCMVRDSFSINIYNDNGQTTTLQQNKCFNTPGVTTWHRSGQGAAYGGVIVNENTSRMLPSSNITYNQNIFVACNLDPGPGNEPVWYSTFGANTGLISSVIVPNTFFSTPALYSARHGPVPL